MSQNKSPSDRCCSHFAAMPYMEECSEWPVSAAFTSRYCKVPTVATYNSRGEQIAWGWEAESKALRHEGTCLRQFKLNLDQPGHVTLPPGVDITTAIANYLGAMKDFILQQIARKQGSEVPVWRIQWCITVPAIWSSPAKETMRVAAQRCEMVSGPYGLAGVGACMSRGKALIATSCVSRQSLSSAYCAGTRGSAAVQPISPEDRHRQVCSLIAACLSLTTVHVQGYVLCAA